MRPRSLPELRSAVRHINKLAQAAQYKPMATALPGLLTELHTAAHTLTGEAQRETWGLLAEAYRCGHSVGIAIGLNDLSTTALNRIWTGRALPLPGKGQPTQALRRPGRPALARGPHRPHRHHQGPRPDRPRTMQVLPAPEGLNFPHVHQVFLIERQVTDLKGAPLSNVAVLGVTDLTPAQADAPLGGVEDRAGAIY